MQRAISSQEHVVVLTSSITRGSRDCLKKNSGVPKCCACVAKPFAYCCFDRKSNKNKFSSKVLNERTLEDCVDGFMTKYRKVLEEAVNVTSTNRGFRTMKHSVATYEQTKKGLSYLYPKRLVGGDGIHTEPIVLWIFLWTWSCSFLINFTWWCLVLFIHSN